MLPRLLSQNASDESDGRGSPAPPASQSELPPGSSREQWLVEAPPPGKPVFSHTRRIGTRLLMFPVFFAALICPMLLGLLLMFCLVPAGTGPVAAAIFFASFAAVVVVCLRLPQRFLLFGNGGLRRYVGEKLARAGAEEAVRSGEWVGLAVGEEPCMYDGDTDWDVGFLVLRPGTLLYCGDRARFALRADQVTRLTLTDPLPPLEEEVRLQIDWCDTASVEKGVLTLTIRRFRNWGEARQKVEAFLTELERWQRQGVPLQQPPLSLPLPPVAVSGGVPRRPLWRGVPIAGQLPRPAAPPQLSPEVLPIPDEGEAGSAAQTVKPGRRRREA